MPVGPAVTETSNRQQASTGRPTSVSRRSAACGWPPAALFDRALNLLFVGNLDRVKTAAEEGLADARQHHIQFVEQVCSDLVAAVLLARCDFEAFSALADERGTGGSYLLDLFRAARAEMAGDLETAVSLLPDPRVAGGAPQYLGQLHAGRARVLLSAGRLEQARHEFALMREAFQNNPFSEVIDGIAVHGVVFGSLDETLSILADEHFLAAVLAFPDRGNFFDPNARSSQRTRAALKLHLGRLEEAEEGFRRALAWCERERCPVEAGRCLQGLAEIAAQRDDVAEAMQFLDRAGELFRRHGAKLYLDQVITRKLQLQGLGDMDIKTSIDAVYAAVRTERPDISVHAAADGKVTLMFSDIEDSTPLAERLGDEAWVALLREHNAIFREQIAAHDGHEVKTSGDAFMVAFQSTANALRCATAVQSAFAMYNREHPDEPLRVRIGLHTGEAVRDAGDFYGKNVILASRIVNEARGGEILVSAVLKEIVDGTGEFAFDDGRSVSLKGLAGEQQIYEIDWREHA